MAAEIINAPTVIPECFNTQPPEGGCLAHPSTTKLKRVSTHSHPKVAAQAPHRLRLLLLRFNTQPPEGGCQVRIPGICTGENVSTHSHPKVAAHIRHSIIQCKLVSTHSHPKVAATSNIPKLKAVFPFQHTATRRWLPVIGFTQRPSQVVSTHSHPKVAAHFPLWWYPYPMRFNTQPPEGGCFSALRALFHFFCFNTQPPEGGCLLKKYGFYRPLPFQHTATRRWLQLSTFNSPKFKLFQHTATRRWLREMVERFNTAVLFQHTATRRWLQEIEAPAFSLLGVSTHSHPKVAAGSSRSSTICCIVSTHSHPKVAARDTWYQLTNP